MAVSFSAQSNRTVCGGGNVLYRQQHANKMHKLEEMDKCLERYDLPRLNWEERENMKRPITAIEIESVIKKFPTNKIPGLSGFTGKF